MVEVSVGDPHNDQVAMAVNNDLMKMIKIAQDLRDGVHEQGITDEAALLAATSVSLEDSHLTRHSMASLLAAALMYIIRKQEDWDEIAAGFELVVGVLTERATSGGFGWRTKESVRQEYVGLLTQLAEALRVDTVIIELDLEEREPEL